MRKEFKYLRAGDMRAYHYYQYAGGTVFVKDIITLPTGEMQMELQSGDGLLVTHTYSPFDTTNFWIPTDADNVRKREEPKPGEPKPYDPYDEYDTKYSTDW